MSIAGELLVACPGCGRRRKVTLVQSINTLADPEAKQRLVAGELNLLACSCGRTTQLAANLLFHDPVADYYARVCPGDARALADAVAVFRASGAMGRQRLVPSQNALVEKVKLLDADLEDWVIELVKVVLLSTLGDLERVLLFDHVARVDHEPGGTLHWLLFDAEGRAPRALASPLEGYTRLAATARPPAPSELQIDRAWAVTAAQALLAAGN
ncbi:MAG: CpXC domain-containing protein [Proteobacteria bacterium]|nr:CpXC domain-containing protein [Pseudomonadota bacterium]